METGCKVTTFDVDAAKVRLARETFRMAGVEAWVEPVEADARQQLPAMEGFSFCFIDAEKELYLDCYELVIPGWCQEVSWWQITPSVIMKSWPHSLRLPCGTIESTPSWCPLGKATCCAVSAENLPELHDREAL